MKTVKIQMRRLVTSDSFYYYFRLQHLLASVTISKFKDGLLHLGVRKLRGERVKLIFQYKLPIDIINLLKNVCKVQNPLALPTLSV